MLAAGLLAYQQLLAEFEGASGTYIHLHAGRSISYVLVWFIIDITGRWLVSTGDSPQVLPRCAPFVDGIGMQQAGDMRGRL
jgi:hypothetical protein